MSIKIGARTLTYRVSFTRTAGASRETRRVHLIEGYTTLADIPRILGVNMGIDAEPITIITLALEHDTADDVEEEPTPTAGLCGTDLQLPWRDEDIAMMEPKLRGIRRCQRNIGHSGMHSARTDAELDAINARLDAR